MTSKLLYKWKKPINQRLLRSSFVCEQFAMGTGDRRIKELESERVRAEGIPKH